MFINLEVKMGETGLITSISSEFLVMSLLFRAGFEPQLTLGTKKQIDIYVRTPKGRVITIDVKGLRSKTNWPIGNQKQFKCLRKNKNHFYVLISYKRRFNDPNNQPDIFIVPAPEAAKLAKKWPGNDQYSIEYADVKDSKFKDAWNLIGQ